MLLLSVALMLVIAGLPPGAPMAQAANSQGPLLAAWMASELVGVPHAYGGSNPEQGLDNCGLVHYVYRSLGVDMPRSVASQAKFGKVVDKSRLVAGDLVFFNSPSSSSVSHVGIYLGDGDFVASSSDTNGVVRRNLSQSYYSKHWAGARRVDASEFLPLYQVIGEKAKASVGIPYRDGGASADGLDNVGLVTYLYSFHYLQVPESLGQLAESGVRVSKSSLRPGDMVFFRGATLPKPYRVGMYVGNNQFVITDKGFGKVVLRDLRDAWYSDRYLEARRPWATFVAPKSFSTPPAQPSEPPTKPTEPPTQQSPPGPQPSVAEHIVEEAMKHLGKPYALNAKGPDVFDCSGFSRYVFGRFGYSLPRASYNQAKMGSAVSRQGLQAGDLVFFKNTWRNNGDIDHVAIYIGNNQVIHAITSGVKINKLTGYWLDHYATARRVLTP
ncbi:MAG: C40 family peptidase [Bacillota bacterium]|jgi:cell wall-associated NlpC family hydrolase